MWGQKFPGVLILVFGAATLYNDTNSAFTDATTATPSASEHDSAVRTKEQLGTQASATKDIVNRSVKTESKTNYVAVSSIFSTYHKVSGVLLGDEVGTRQAGEEESLTTLLRWILEREFAGCSLLLALDHSYLTSPLVTHLSSSHYLKQVVLIHDMSDLLTSIWTSNLYRAYIFLLQNSSPLLTFGNQYLKSWDYYGKYIIAGLSVEELNTLAETMKGKKTQHIVGLVKSGSGGDWRVYVNQVYAKQMMIFQSTWRGSGFTHTPVLFPEKTLNLHGTTISVAAFEFPPDVIYDRQKEGQLRLYGREVEIIKALAHVCNFTIKFVEPPPDELWGTRLPNGTYNGIVGMLGRGTVDLGISSIFINSLMGRMDMQHYSTPTDQNVNCVMLRVPQSLPRWQAPFWPFTENMWLAIAAGLLLSGPVLYCMAQYSGQSHWQSPYLKSLSSGYLLVIAMHLQEPMPQMANTNSSRVLMAFLWLYTMVLGLSYCSKLVAFLTVARQPRTIDTFKDLHESGLGIISGGPYYGNLMMEAADKHIGEMYKRYTVVTSNPESWVVEGRAGYINTYNSVKYMVTKINTAYRTPFLRIMKECIWPNSLGIAMQTYSPLKPRVDKIILRITDSGLMHQWLRQTIRFATQKTQQKKTVRQREGGDEGNEVVALKIDHMQSVFYILATSCIASILVFLAELWLGRRQRTAEA